MKKHVILNSVSDVIDVFGGQAKLAQRLKISQPGVSKWKKLNKIPMSQVLPVLIALSSRGYLMSSDLFNIRGVTGVIFATSYQNAHESDVNGTQNKHISESAKANKYPLFEAANIAAE